MGVVRLALFGSASRGEPEEHSDLDFLVELRRESFDDYMDVKFFLADLLRRPVDLVLFDAIKPRLRDRILGDAVYVQGLQRRDRDHGRAARCRTRLVDSRRMSRIGRNEACPCGSGRKYKKCCLRADEDDARVSRADPGADGHARRLRAFAPELEWLAPVVCENGRRLARTVARLAALLRTGAPLAAVRFPRAWFGVVVARHALGERDIDALWEATRDTLATEASAEELSRALASAGAHVRGTDRRAVALGLLVLLMAPQGSLRDAPLFELVFRCQLEELFDRCETLRRRIVELGDRGVAAGGATAELPPELEELCDALPLLLVIDEDHAEEAARRARQALHARRGPALLTGEEYIELFARAAAIPEDAGADERARRLSEAVPDELIETLRDRVSSWEAGAGVTRAQRRRLQRLRAGLALAPEQVVLAALTRPRNLVWKEPRERDAFPWPVLARWPLGAELAGARMGAYEAYLRDAGYAGAADRVARATARLAGRR